MLAVDNYVERLYKHAHSKHPVTQELKEETRIHLQESVDELILNGYTEKDAIKVAIERFGGHDQAEELISIMEIRQSSFARSLLKIGISTLAAMSAIFIFLLYLGNIHDAHFADIGYSLGENSSSTTKDLGVIFSEEPFLYNAMVSKLDSQGETLSFQRENNWVPSIFQRKMNYGTDQSFVLLEIIDIRTIGFFLLLIGITTYYVLSTIWGVIQLYQLGFLKLRWLFVLLALNIVGYLLVLTIHKDEIEKEIA